MFNLGLSEIIMIAVLALVLFGPDKLPELAKTLAHFIKEFRRMSGELQSTVHETVATLNEENPKAPNLKELYDRIDPKRALDVPRPFADPVPGTVVAAAAADGGPPVAGPEGASPLPDEPITPWAGHMTSPPEAAAGEGGVPHETVATADLLCPTPTEAGAVEGAVPIVAAAPEASVTPAADTAHATVETASTVAPPATAAQHEVSPSQAPAMEKPAASERTDGVAHEQIGHPADRT